MTNISRSTLQRLEYGLLKDIKLSTIYKILDYYQITFEDLISKK